MTFDTAFERSHPPNEPMKDSDTGIVYQVILGWVNNGNQHWNKCLEQGDLGQLSKHIANTVLTTVRKEAQAAAFKEAARAVRQCSLRSEKYPNRYITAAAFKTRAECVIERAAANTEEGAGHG